MIIDHERRRVVEGSRHSRARCVAGGLIQLSVRSTTIRGGELGADLPGELADNDQARCSWWLAHVDECPA